MSEIKVNINPNSNRRLWVYGCSYSDNWNDRVIPYEETWWGIVAKELNLNVVRNHHEEKDDIISTQFGLGGQGWNSVERQILMTMNEWSKDDVIIIEEPPRTRSKWHNLKLEGWENMDHKILSTILPEQYNNKPLFKDLQLNDYNRVMRHEAVNLDSFSGLQDIYLIQGYLNWSMYRGTIESLTQHFPNIHTWNFEGGYLDWYWGEENKLTTGAILPLWDEFKDKPYRLKFGIWDTYIEWMDKTPIAWANWKKVDDHQNGWGHKVMGKMFVKQLRTKYGL